ncbi:metallophosphatase domain-containing protein [Flavobacterium sp. CBA20B-1]|uniref:metallophosphatase domain-containing protein n=1 Tax=unclassified Flavobacterium TaxID=196869 RepID=UPI002224279C|nr:MULTISPECIES: metallophosphatase domain-containing protein [unclassified Flavobacterium]WCM41598.1 metallophosphatase domain-containing protein [Flavobacterium sp. CBA20B-1]
MIIDYNQKRLAVFADTHGKHRKLPLIKTDIAIHLGDACTLGNNSQFSDFLDWFSQYPAKYKLFVAGNHELQWMYEPDEFLKMFPPNIIFLENRNILLEGINFASVAARMNLSKYPRIKLSKKVDFLLTHAPPTGILDNGFGCAVLKKFVTKIKPAYHLFGHVHETGGTYLKRDETIFMNVSVFNQ